MQQSDQATMPDRNTEIIEAFDKLQGVRERYAKQLGTPGYFKRVDKRKVLLQYHKDIGAALHVLDVAVAGLIAERRTDA